MRYNLDDINFKELSPTEFENLCYDLVVKYNFQKPIWRQGGADNGRDIESFYTISNSLVTKETKWFFECKHYSKGVPPEELNSKIAWADAEQPDFFVIFTTSYITTSARTWLKSISKQKKYDIIVIEGDELKNRVLKYSDLVERYFSLNKYLKLYLDAKRYKIQYGIMPSYEFLKEILTNIDFDRLELNDLSSLIMNFYENYYGFEGRKDYYGDFDPTITYRLLSYLKTQEDKGDQIIFDLLIPKFDELGGVGCFEDAEIEEISDKNFQYQILHLNYLESEDQWKTAFYFFIRIDSEAFEILSISNSSAFKYYDNYTVETLSQLGLKFHPDYIEKYLKYCPKLR